MANFKDFFKKEEKPARPEPEHLRVGGTFTCQTCDEVVHYANKIDGKLIWTCSQNHVSKVNWS